VTTASKAPRPTDRTRPQRIALCEAAGNLYYVVPDQLGSANVTYKSDGTDTKGQRYYPYGQLRPSPIGGPIATDRAYTGQTLDATTGLTHMGARDYDPSTQTFTSADTITPGTTAAALNRYAYVNGNPLTGIDPTGHSRNMDPSCQEDINCRKDLRNSQSGEGRGARLATEMRSDPEGKTHVDVKAFIDYSHECHFDYSACVAAAVLDMGGSTDDAWDARADYCRQAAYGGSCDDGGVYDDEVFNFILIDLPTTLLTSGVVSYVGDRLVLGTATTETTEAVNEGIYVVTRSDGAVYVGQSSNIDARLAQHVRADKFTQAEVDQAERFGVSGGKTDREIAEQLKIDEFGGKKAVLNVVNPIGDARINLMPKGYVRPQ